MEDALDFCWANAKAAHAVLLCEMERGAVCWTDTECIDRIRRAHAQKHSTGKQNWVRTTDLQKNCDIASPIRQVCVYKPKYVKYKCSGSMATLKG